MTRIGSRVAARRLLCGSMAALLFAGGLPSWVAEPSGVRLGPRPVAATSAPGATPDPGIEPGERIYAVRCAVCHGVDGRGDGPLAAARRPRPRDFSGGVFKVKSTPPGEPPTRDDIRRGIRRGMGGGAMPAWGALLSAAEIDAVTEHVRRLGPLAEWSPPERAVPVPGEILVAASVERGRELYRDLGCPTCHGAEGKGDGPAAAALKDVWKQPAPPRDLTAPWTYIGGESPEDLYRRVSIGIPGTPMPGYAESATAEDIAAVVAYLRSIARRRP